MVDPDAKYQSLKTKRYYYQYRNEYIKTLFQKEVAKENKLVIKDEYSFFTRLGLNKTEEEFMAEYNSITQGKDSQKAKRDKDVVKSFIVDSKYNDFINQKRQMEAMQMKLKMETTRKDIKYVKKLSEWDEIHLGHSNSN